MSSRQSAFSWLLWLAPALAQAEPEADSEAEADAEPTPAFSWGRVMDGAAEHRKEELKSPRYEFCNDEDYDPPDYAREQRRFCRLFNDSSKEACPLAEKMCEESESWWSQLHFPKEAAYLILAFSVLALVFLFVRALRKKSWGEEIAEFDPSAAIEAAEQLAQLPEAPALSILRRAREKLAEDQDEEGAILIQVALLRHFDDAGLVEFHPSRTNGEYLRALRRYVEHKEVYRKIAKETDRVRFGDGKSDGQAVRQVLEEAERVVRLPAESAASDAPVAPVATLLFLAFFAPLGCGPGGRDWYSHAPDGLSALPALLRAEGIEVVMKRGQSDDLPADTTAVLIHSTVAGAMRPSEHGFFGKDGESLDALLDRGLPVVLLDDLGVAAEILPLTSTVPPGCCAAQPKAMELELAPEIACGLDFVEASAALGPQNIKRPLGHMLFWDGRPRRGSNTRHVSGLVPLLVESGPDLYRGEAVAWAAMRMGDDGQPLAGCFFVFQGKELFTNASLSFAPNARFAVAFFAALMPLDGVRKIVFLDLGSKGGGGVQSMSETRLMPFVLQAGVFVVALFLFLGAAFGPLRDPVKKEHKAFAEHVAALGSHYAALGVKGRTHAARALARWLVVRHRHQARGTQGWGTVAEHLAESYGLDPALVRAALRLGMESPELLTSGIEPPPHSEEMLQTLSTLLAGKLRDSRAAPGRR